MHSLYWRIFLAFWVALVLILVGTLTVALHAMSNRTDRPWVERGHLYNQAASAFESGGPEALRLWLSSLSRESLDRTFIVEPGGEDMLHRPLPPSLYAPGRGAPRIGESRASLGPIAPIGGALILMTPTGGGSYHVVIGPVRSSPRLFGELELPGVPLELLLIALGVSAAVCLVLARYLAAPVDRLRLATRQLANGDLNVRVLPALKGRQDDLGLLAADLDSMAERLRQLLEGKQQLLRDVSHELRSPLTRLQLALSLAQRDPSATQRYLERAGLEADRLEQLIARVLMLARLERTAPEIEQTSVDVEALLRMIAAEVAIEADAHACRVNLRTEGVLLVRGEAELLRSAFENVIRNAVGFSPVGGAVELSARERLDSRGAPLVEVSVLDCGRGVPEKDLRLIFEPFYRVDAAREHRRTGGEGLGLAIAARAIGLHGGSIVAANATAGGLLVTVTLPGIAQAPAARAPATAVTA